MSDLATLDAKDRIAACIYDLFIGTDQRDWSKVRACLAERVRFDMTSLAGGAAQDLSPDEIARGWETGLKAIEHVHHQAGNLRIAVAGDRATAFCYAIALHYRATRSGNNVRRFVGSYDFSLQKIDMEWRITAFRFNVKFIDGTLDLEKAP